MLREIALFLLICSAAPGKPFTLEQVLSAPFPSDLVAAPTGGKVAWLLNERGARNIYAAEAPDYKGRRLTEYLHDDGQDIGQMHWTPDGKSIVYTRGGDLEMGRDNPNPRSVAERVEQAIWLVTAGSKPRKLAEGHSPEI